MPSEKESFNCEPFYWGEKLVGEALYPSVEGATAMILEELRTVIRSDDTIDELVFRRDHPEPPSVQLAIELMLAQENRQLKCRFEGDEQHFSGATFAAVRPLWEICERRLVPAVDEPASAIKATCSDIVTRSDDCVDSWKEAASLVDSNNTADIDSILAVMVYPPPVAGELTPTAWLRQIQLAAAQWAVRIEHRDGVSVRDSKVADLTRGPIDWSIDAALVALAQRAAEETDLITEVTALATEVIQRIPKEGTWSTKAVCQSVLRYLELAETSNS